MNNDPEIMVSVPVRSEEEVQNRHSMKMEETKNWFKVVELTSSKKDFDYNSRSSCSQNLFSRDNSTTLNQFLVSSIFIL